MVQQNIEPIIFKFFSPNYFFLLWLKMSSHQKALLCITNSWRCALTIRFLIAISRYCPDLISYHQYQNKNFTLNHAQVLNFDHRRVQVPGEHRHRRLPPAKDGHGSGTHGLNVTKLFTSVIYQ